MKHAEGDWELASLALDACARLALDNLDGPGLRRLVDARGLFADGPFSGLESKAAGAIAAELARGGSSEGFDGLLGELRQDYSRLFYMARMSGFSPYESVYRSEDGTLFGPVTLEVRDAFRAFGFDGEAKRRSVPDDHLGLEAAFVAALMRASLEEPDGSGATAPRAREAARAFMSEHLLVFAPHALSLMERGAQTPFYRAVAAFFVASVAHAAELLGAQATGSVFDGLRPRP